MEVNMNELEFNEEIRKLYKNIHDITKDDQFLEELSYIDHGEGVVSLYMAAWTIIDDNIRISRNDYLHLSKLINLCHMKSENRMYIDKLYKKIDDNHSDRLFLS